MQKVIESWWALVVLMALCVMQIVFVGVAESDTTRIMAFVGCFISGWAIGKWLAMKYY